MLSMLLLGVAAVTVLYQKWKPDFAQVKTLSNLKHAGRATLLDREGRVVKVIGVSRAGEIGPARKHLGLSQISPWLQKAVVASEDIRFYQHNGIDHRGLSRALWKTLSGDMEGGSTLTQQVVKNTLLSDLKGARTPERKFKEALFALEVEKQFTKHQILELYLNLIYWGVARTDLVGAGDAAKAYFNKPAQDLNLAESVYLAVLLPTPARYNDYSGYRPLMKDLLDRMVEAGNITPKQANEAWKHPLQPAGWKIQYGPSGEVVKAQLTDPQARKKHFPIPEYTYADAFLDQVERELVQKVPMEAFYTSDVRVHTTLNRKVQLAAEQASKKASIPRGATLGMAIVDPHSGEVQALVGQKLNDGIADEWNHATRTRRQVGSSIKPLLYTLALSRGWDQTDTVLDAPLKGKYQPQNYSGRFSGEPIMLRAALNQSLNLPTVRLLQKLGVHSFKQKLTLLGLKPDPQAGLSIGIGALEATPLEMAAAYAPFANWGKRHTTRVIQRITSNGKTLYEVKPSRPVKVWSPQVAYMGLDMIRGVVGDLTPAQGGLGWKARIPGWQVGGKTGTTNDVKDLWFVGVTPKWVGAVWVGKPDNTSMPKTAYSGDIAAPIWQKTMSLALKGEEKMAFLKPSGIRTINISGRHMAFLKNEIRPQSALVASRPRATARQATPVAVNGRTPSKPKPTPKTVVRSAIPKPAVVLKRVPITQVKTQKQSSRAAFMKRQQEKARLASMLSSKTRQHFQKQYQKYLKKQGR